MHKPVHKFIGFGAMVATKPHKFIGFGAMDATEPYKFIGFGAMDVTWLCFKRIPMHKPVHIILSYRTGNPSMGESLRLPLKRTRFTGK